MGDDRSCRRGRREGWRTKVGQWAPRRRFRLTAYLLDKAIVFQYVPRRGYIPAEVRGGPGCFDLLDTFPVVDFRPMKRRQLGGSGTAATVKHLAPLESNVWAKCLSVLKHIAITQYDDGTPRRVGSVYITTVGSAYKIVLKDPDAGAQLQVIGDTFDNALAAATLLLESEDAPWEVDQWAKGQKGRKTA